MAAGGRQPHVIIINDTQEILDLLEDLLEDEGYRVTTSPALLNIDKAKKLDPDVIVQNLLFEGTQEQGRKMLHLLRLDPKLARVPIVLCTGPVNVVREPAMAEKLDRLGVRVILKPFNIDELLDVLREVRIAQGAIDKALDE